MSSDRSSSGRLMDAGHGDQGEHERAVSGEQNGARMSAGRSQRIKSQRSEKLRGRTTEPFERHELTSYRAEGEYSFERVVENTSALHTLPSAARTRPPRETGIPLSSEARELLELPPRPSALGQMTTCTRRQHNPTKRQAAPVRLALVLHFACGLVMDQFGPSPISLDLLSVSTIA